MSKKKNFAVILSGCGVYDGTEIHEATMTLYSIVKNGGTYEIFAPDVEQHHVINHITGEEMKETRNVLVESARIARGNIYPLNVFHAKKFDGIIFPGGFGAAKNLSSYAFNGADMKVINLVTGVIRMMIEEKKPIGALCISPVLLAKVIGNVEVTIGQDEDTIEKIKALGATHTATDQGEVVVDKDKKVVTTPCYMLNADIVQIAEGADNVVKAMIDLME